MELRRRFRAGRVFDAERCMVLRRFAVGDFELRPRATTGAAERRRRPPLAARLRSPKTNQPKR